MTKDKKHNKFNHY